jgi:hypothetical protein
MIVMIVMMMMMMMMMMMVVVVSRRSKSDFVRMVNFFRRIPFTALLYTGIIEV